MKRFTTSKIYYCSAICSILLKVFFVFILTLAVTLFADPPCSSAQQGSNYSYTREELQRLLCELQDEDDQTRSYEAVVSIFFDECHITETLGTL